MRDTLRHDRPDADRNASCQVTIVREPRWRASRRVRSAARSSRPPSGEPSTSSCRSTPRSVAGATNVGKPVADGRSKVAAAIQQIAERVAGNQAAGSGTAPVPALAVPPAMTMFGRKTSPSLLADPCRRPGDARTVSPAHGRRRWPAPADAPSVATPAARSAAPSDRRREALTDDACTNSGRALRPHRRHGRHQAAARGTQSPDPGADRRELVAEQRLSFTAASRNCSAPPSSTT